jgi:acylglycerol lipase
VRGRPAPDLLVLSAPALAATVPAWRRAAAGVLSRVVPTAPIKSDLDGALLSRDETVGSTYRDDPLRVRVTTARAAAEFLAAMKSTSANLDRITLPTYVLHGSEDRLVKPSASEPFEARPNATRVVYDGLRHECLNEPEQGEVLAGILAWIDGRLSSVS